MQKLRSRTIGKMSPYLTYHITSQRRRKKKTHSVDIGVLSPHKFTLTGILVIRRLALLLSCQVLLQSSWKFF